MHKFLVTYGLDAWLVDPYKAAEIWKWANKNDFYLQIEEAKAERKIKRASERPSRDGAPSKPQPPLPPINPTSRKSAALPVSNEEEVEIYDQLNIEETLNEKSQNWVEIKRKYSISSGEEEDEVYDLNYDSDEWD